MRYNGNISLGKQATFHDVTTGFHWFPREMTSREQAQKFHIDNVLLRKSLLYIWLVEAYFPCGPTNHKHYPHLASGTSSVWNFCFRSSDVISRGNQWCRRERSTVFSCYTNISRRCHKLKSPYPQKNVLLRNFSLQFNGRFSSLCHRWQIENPGRCSARCGLGYQSRVVKCVRVHNDRWGEVLDKHCPSKTKPPLFVRCNGTCEGTKWVYSQWSKVSVAAVKRHILRYFTHPWMRIKRD